MSSISSATSVDAALTSAPSNRFNDLTSEEFIRIIFTELTNQDPLQPNDTSALLDQLNSIRSIESDLQLTERLEALVTENQLASASNLIGRFVGGRTEDFDAVSGFVVSALRQGDDITLELDTGWTIPIENVETIIDPSIFAAPAPDPVPATGDDATTPDEPETP